MCEVTINNFNEILTELEVVLKKTRFVSIDAEFSCLTASQKLQNSLFDTAHERFTKLRITVEQMIPIQIGLTAFTFNPDDNSYTGHAYTFYVFPRSFSFIDTKFLCQASSFHFLSFHQFDFNKCVKEGVPYLNRIQESELNSRKSSNYGFSESSMPYDIESLSEESGKIVTEWIYKAKDNDVLILKNVENCRNNLDLKYFLHKDLRQRFKNLWTFEDSEGFKVKKTTASQYQLLEKSNNLENCFISDLLGFTKVIRMLTSLQKPLVGHNLLLDLMVIVHNFEKPLPKSFNNFKKVVHDLFPTIYDTKCISHEIISTVIPESKRWRQNTLPSLYEYFKDGYGRHLALNCPFIEPAAETKQHFHFAGWDSYCTGYIFIRMAHIYAAQRCPVRGKKFMSTELLQAVMKFKNSVNVIRADVSHIQLDGEDPASKRPPWLIVETNSDRPVNINQVASLLSKYGFVEVKPHSLMGHRAIIAVDNFGSARRILNQFATHSDFKIQKYSALKHSSIARAVLWTGILTSGAFLMWYGYLRLK